MMREKGLGWILRELAGDRQAMATKTGEEMDVDERQQVTISKTGNVALDRPFNQSVR